MESIVPVECLLTSSAYTQVQEFGAEENYLPLPPMLFDLLQGSFFVVFLEIFLSAVSDAIEADVT